MLATNLQTFFLTRSFNFTLHHLRGTATGPRAISDFCRDVVSYIVIQLQTIVALPFGCISRLAMHKP